MQRNSNAHFAENPTFLDMPRSKFRRPFDHKTTFNVGDLIPLMVDEVLPGDTYNVKMGAAVRMSTPIYPVFDNAYMDIYHFFVPSRLLWTHFREFMGENRESKWAQEVEYTIPQITAPEGGFAKGTIADYMGIPTKVPNLSVNALPFRAYALIWNEWFRDQNLKDPCYINYDDTTRAGSNGTNYITDCQLGGMPAKAAKYADYFTKALPAPQKGQSVMAPLMPGDAKVITKTDKIDTTGYPTLHFKLNGQEVPTDGNGAFGLNVTASNASTGGGLLHLATSTAKKANGDLVPDNLWATFENTAGGGISINELRQAFAIQRYYERLARGGSRYRELVKAFFGVTSPDARMQIPEYLGGQRVTIGMQQVVQTSSTNTTSPQGNTSAMSLTNFVDSGFTQSFTEHGYIMTLGVVRTEHTYQQGLERMWSRKDKFDFYFPVFANLGEMAVLNKEIYAQGNTTDDEVFGYQEAWADYRYKNSRVSGAMRSNYAQPLDSWHYADYYKSQPFLSSNWIDETRENVNRTIAVQDENEDQMIGDFYFELETTRCMPVYSIPGLLDHH